MEKQITDKELGVIVVRTHPRARHYTLKIRNNQILATMPPGGNETRLYSFIEENREKLSRILHTKKENKSLFDESDERQYTSFQLHIFRTERNNFYMKLENGILHIACPQNTVFSDVKVQELIQGLIERALRHEAKRLLPERLHQLAGEYKFSYQSVRINNSKTRWGSCNSKKGINLSLSLMTLPWHLIDYVLLHELCHTIEMNHSDRFWDLMNKVTGNKALLLRKELKNYSI